MSFNPYEQKGISLEKQLRNWHQLAHFKFNKNDIDCYSRTRQILMNGIEIEAWGYKHAFSRLFPDKEACDLVSLIRKIEDQQQTTVNFMSPEDQTVLETTLAYEQVAVDLTAWLALNEPDDYVKETFDFGLIEDFDHLYRYSQWCYMMHGIKPNDVVQSQTDIFLGRPTQYHHNQNDVRIRKPYDKDTTLPQTKINIMTLIAAEQQTHNYYAEHGMEYGNNILRETYAEIKDVEEEHVTMYESLIDRSETMLEKLLLHEYCEVCNYYTCYKDEPNEKMKHIWELFLSYELEHLHLVADLFKKHEKRDPEEVTGNKIIIPSHFESNQKYVGEIVQSEIDKRLDDKMGYCKTYEIDADWRNYDAMKKMNDFGAATEQTIHIIAKHKGADIVKASDELKDKQVELLAKAVDENYSAPNTVMPVKLEKMKEIRKGKKNFKLDIEQHELDK
ncbi:MAG: hypothetical protein R3Y28_03950 [Candidatus Gastranaerophilales bacterium]